MHIFPVILLVNVLKSHVHVVTLIALDRVPQEGEEHSVGEDLVDLLIVPHTDHKD